MRAEPGRARDYREQRDVGFIFPAQEAGMTQSVVAWHFTEGSEEGVILQCVITAPPSSAGRQIQLWIEADTAEELMKDLRAFAISRRQTSEVGPVDVG